MKCAYCEKDFPLGKLRFKPTGMHPTLRLKTHAAQCYNCAKAYWDKLDGRVNKTETVSDGEAPF